MNKKDTTVLGIFGNISKPEVSGLLFNLIKFLEKIKTEFLIDRSLLKILKADQSRHAATVNQILQNADFIVSLGGDGTFLNTARLVGDKNIPILGINLGRLGFYSEISPDEYTDFIPKLLKGKFKITEQVVLKSVYKNKVHFGLNDIVVDKSDSIRMVETETYYEDEKVFRCISDGIIVSTPAGSTGYSLSCNGPIVNPDSNVFVITPISPHTFNVRPIIVPDTGNIRILLPNRGIARITADGQRSAKIITPSELTVSKANFRIKVIKKQNYSYFHTLKKKLYWNVDKRYS
ncbi:MAG: NAD(+)/NADH kinase [Ignavibacteria bacterium]|nr:NAD(+)/NADH kinase [Ignavibacteria bacterium]